MGIRSKPAAAKLRTVTELTKATRVRVEDLPPAVSAEDLDSLAELLCDSVEGGASVSFMTGATRAETRAFWAGKLAVRAPRSAALVVPR